MAPSQETIDSIDSQDIERLRGDIVRALNCPHGEATYILNNLTHPAKKTLAARIVEIRNEYIENKETPQHITEIELRAFITDTANHIKPEKPAQPLADNQPTGENVPTSNE